MPGSSRRSYEVGHVGNFVADLFCGQGILGGFFAHVYPELTGMPTSRHEAACASGSMALLAAMRDIEAGHYDTACVLGIELMRNVDGQNRRRIPRRRGLAGPGGHGLRLPLAAPVRPYLRRDTSSATACTTSTWRVSPRSTSQRARNPNAQSRAWQFPDGCFGEDDRLNPVVEGRVRKLDCGQITDGAACVVLAGRKRGPRPRAAHGLRLADLPRIKGWGHRSAPLALERKLALSAGQPLLFPHVADTISDALRRGGFAQVTEVDGLETHDCFTITEYLAIDHSGLTAPGAAWQAVEEGRIASDGTSRSIPVAA
jgi:acetyl-CoA C-acetyltransferase